MPNFTNFRFQDLTEYSNGIEMHKATNLVYKHKQKTLCLPATHRSVGLIVQEGEEVEHGPRKGRSRTSLWTAIPFPKYTEQRG